MATAEYQAPTWYSGAERAPTPSVAYMDITAPASRASMRSRSARPHTAGSGCRRPASQGARRARNIGGGAWCASASRPRSAASVGGAGNYMRSSRSAAALPQTSVPSGLVRPQSSTTAWRPAAPAPQSFFDEFSATATGMKLQMRELQTDAENIQTKTAEAKRTTDSLRVTHSMDCTIAEFKMSMGAEVEKSKDEIFHFIELAQAETAAVKSAVDTLQMEADSIKAVVKKMRNRVSAVQFEIGYA